MGKDRFTAHQLQPPHSPDYFDQFTHVDMVWDKELGLVQHWQLFLPFIAFDDDLGRKSMVGSATVHSAPRTGLKVKHKSNYTKGKVEVRPHFASPSQGNLTEGHKQCPSGWLQTALQQKVISASARQWKASKISELKH